MNSFNELQSLRMGFLRIFFLSLLSIFAFHMQIVEIECIEAVCLISQQLFDYSDEKDDPEDHRSESYSDNSTVDIYDN